MNICEYNNKFFFVFSHHEKEKSVAVCHTIFRLFFSENPIIPNAEYVYVRDAFAVKHALKKISPNDICFFNGLGAVLTEFGIEAIQNLTLQQVPITIYIHEGPTLFSKLKNNPSWNQLIDLFNSNTHLFTFWAVSMSVKGVLEVMIGAEPEQIRVVHNIMDNPYSFPTIKRRHKQHYKVAMGSLGSSYRKGLDYFCHIAEQCSRHSIPISFYWVGSYDTEYYSEYVSFVKPVDNFINYLIEHDIDAICCPSRGDSGPLVLAEGMSLDIPAFCFDTCGMAEDLPMEFVAFDVDDMIRKLHMYFNDVTQYPTHYFKDIVLKTYSGDMFLRRAFSSSYRKIDKSQSLIQPVKTDISLDVWYQFGQMSYSRKFRTLCILILKKLRLYKLVKFCILRLNGSK